MHHSLSDNVVFFFSFFFFECSIGLQEGKIAFLPVNLCSKKQNQPFRSAGRDLIICSETLQHENWDLRRVETQSKQHLEPAGSLVAFTQLYRGYPTTQSWKK